ncbi:MAG: MBL fold metallo-hydrolase RNA specificity domain-containing protein, partial [Solirubrobacterales bacterium]
GSLPGRLLGADKEAARASRPFSLLGELPSGLGEALKQSPFGAKTKFEPIAPVRARPDFDGVRYRFHGVDHSVYGAAGYLIEADGGTVAYTGDIRFHGERGRDTEGFLSLLEKKSPEVLVVEGTRLLASDQETPPALTSEADVEQNCLRDVLAYEGRLVIADFGPRNVERLKTFERIAHASGRQLVLTPKDAYLLHLLHTVDPSIPDDISPGGMRVLEEPSVGSERAWLRRVQSSDESAFLNPVDVAKSKSRYILCFSFFDCNDLVDLRHTGATEGGLWLYSSSEAHGEEQEFDFVRLQNWIRWAGMHQVGFRYVPDERGGRRLTFDHPEDLGHHASGHATQSELLEFVYRARPKIVVPVHTVQPARRYQELLRSRGSPATVVAPVQGQPIRW